MNNSNQGFTLIEILIALTILAITMGAYLYQLDNQIKHTNDLRQRTLGHWLAQNHLTQLQLQGQWLEVGKSKFNLQQGENIWQMEQSISNTPNANIRRIALKVSSPTGDVVSNLVGYLAHEQ